jgi:MSHA biogenesis protein MshO
MTKNNISMARLQRGFTLIEAIMVITLSGIIAAAVAVFIVVPVQAYFDAARRAELSDIVDTALRRMSRDFHSALPNSFRNPVPECIEFLPTISGGRYRAAQNPGGDADILDFAVPDGGFDVLGVLDPVPVAGDRVVVFNLGVPGADAYRGAIDNMARVAAGTNASHIVIDPPRLFPFPSPSRRFSIVPDAEQAVFYVCRGAGTNAAGDGTGTLFRYSHYGINTAAPLACPGATGWPVQPITAVLATNVSRCAIHFEAGSVQPRALISMSLAIKQRNEEVSLYHEVHVDNAP